MKKKWFILLVLCLAMLIACAVTASAAKAKQPKLLLPKTFIIVEGYSDTVQVMGVSDGSEIPADVVYSIAPKKAAFASVDPATGEVQAKKAGNATLTASSATLGKKANATCTIKILSNEYKRATPLKRDGSRGIILSTKRLYYANGALQGEMWVFNRYFTHSLQYVYSQSGGRIAVALVDSNNNVRAATTLPNEVKFKKRVGMNKAGVLYIPFPASTSLLNLRDESFELKFVDEDDVYYRGLIYRGAEAKMSSTTMKTK